MLATVDYLGGPVVPGGNVASFFLFLLSHHGSSWDRMSWSSDAKVSYFKSPILHKVYVAWLNVSVHESLLMNVLDSLDHLVDQAFELLKGESDFFVASELHEGYSQVEHEVVV